MNTKLLKQKILDLAIRGKLVPQNPDDEPASILLQHISKEKENLITQGKIKRSKKADSTNFAQEPPFQIPESWEWCKVEDLFELNPKNKIDNATIVGFIPMELVSAGFGYSHTFQEKEWGKIKKGYCHFQNGDIGIAKISPCFENRKSTIFYDLPNNCGAGTTELVILRGKNVCTKFYLYVFQTEWYLKEGTKYFKGVVGQQRVHKDIFTTLQIPLPPLSEQTRIVACIDEWFRLIDQIETNQTSLQATIKQTKSKILDLAIKGKLVSQNPDDEPAEGLLRRINQEKENLIAQGKIKRTKKADDSNQAEEPPFQIPDSWVWVKLGEISFCTKLAGFEYTNYIVDNLTDNTGIPLFKGKNVQDGKIVYEFESFIPKDISDFLIRSQVNRKCLLTPYVGTIGNIGIHDKKGIFHLGSNVGKIELIQSDGKTIILEEYVLYFLRSTGGLKELSKHKKSTAQESISIEAIRDCFIPLPPLSEQERIVKKIEEVFALLDNISAALAV